MNKIINIKTNKAIKEIRNFRDKKYSLIEIKIKNVHLRELNKLMSFELFDKNDLYINSVTLWELMQPIGNSGSHNYHELSPEDICSALNSITTPKYIFRVINKRYAIVPVLISSYDEPLMIVIEKDAGLINNQNAKINKIVTMYPRNDLDKYLEGVEDKEILYKK